MDSKENEAERFLNKVKKKMEIAPLDIHKIMEIGPELKIENPENKDDRNFNNAVDGYIGGLVAQAGRRIDREETFKSHLTTMFETAKKGINNNRKIVGMETLKQLLKENLDKSCEIQKTK